MISTLRRIIGSPTAPRTQVVPRGETTGPRAGVGPPSTGPPSTPSAPPMLPYDQNLVLRNYNINPLYVISNMRKQFAWKHNISTGEVKVLSASYTTYRNPSTPGIDPRTAELYGILFTSTYVLYGVTYTMHHYEGPNDHLFPSYQTSFVSGNTIVMCTPRHPPLLIICTQ